MTKKEELINKTNSLIANVNNYLEVKILKAINSGAIDVEEWDGNIITPKSIIIAVLEDTADEFRPNRCSKEIIKVVNSNVKNIHKFL